MSCDSIKIKSHSSLIAMRIKRKLSEAPYNDFLTNATKLQYTDNIQNGLYATLTHQRIKQLTNIFIVLLGVNIFMLFLYFEIDYNQNDGSLWLIVTYTIHLLCTIMTLAMNVVEYDSLDKFGKCHYKFHRTFAQILLYFLIHPLPCINQKFFEVIYENVTFDVGYTSIKVNYVILLATLMKNGIIFLTKILINSRYMDPRARRINKIYSVNAEKVIYAIRCIFRDQPIQLFFTFFIFGTVFFSYSLKVIQSNVPIIHNPFKLYANCIWYMLITTTTVGYGQMRPFTHLGYFFIVAATIFGSLCISGTVFILINALTLNHKETAGFMALKRVNSQLLYKENCKIYLKMSLLRLWRNYKKNQKVKETFEQRKLRTKLLQLRREYKSFNSTKNILQLFQREFDSAFNSTEILCDNNVNLVHFINNHIFSQDLLRQYGVNYSKEHYGQSNNVVENDDNSSQDQKYKKKVYKKTPNVESRKHIKIRIIKPPSSNIDSINQQFFQ